jgi:hypothetical protein
MQNTFSTIITNPPLDFNAETLTQLSAVALNPLHSATILVFTVRSLLVAYMISPINFQEAKLEPGTNTYSPKKSEEF